MWTKENENPLQLKLTSFNKIVWGFNYLPIPKKNEINNKLNDNKMDRILHPDIPG